MFGWLRPSSKSFYFRVAVPGGHPKVSSHAIPDSWYINDTVPFSVVTDTGSV